MKIRAILPMALGVLAWALVSPSPAVGSDWVPGLIDRPRATVGDAARFANPLQDGGFEAGTPNPYWTEASTNFGTPLCSLSLGTCGSPGPHSGNWAAWFGGSGASELASVDQDFVVPIGSAQLHFFLSIHTEEVAGARDFLQVRMDDTPVFEATNESAPSYATYEEVVVDISSWADGGIHNLSFLAEEDESLVTSFFVDDVTVIISTDTEPPTWDVPADITVGTDPGLASAVVTYTATASDNVGVVSSACIPPSGSPFPFGTTTVTCIAADAVGNTSTAYFDITVVDFGPPPPPPPPVVLPKALVAHDVGLVTGDNWQLRDHMTGAVRTITFGVAGDVPIMGDWDCNGTETPALFRQTKLPGEPNLPEGLAYYVNDNAPGVRIGEFRFILGNPGDIPLAGDFNGDGCDSLSVYRPSEQQFYIADKLPPPIPLNQPLQAFNADRKYIFGVAGDKPFVGDFNGDGIETVGLHRESTGLIYYLDSHPPEGTSPPADTEYVFGDPGDQLVAGDCVIVDGKWSPALFRSSNATFYFRDDNAPGFKPAASQFPFGTAGSSSKPVSGVMGL